MKKIRSRGIASVASYIGRAIFGQSVLGHSLAYLLALFSLILGMAIGLNVTQPVAVMEPTRTLIVAIDASDKILAAAPGDPRDISAKLDSFRSKILNLDTRERPAALQQRRDLDIYKTTLVIQLNDIDETIKRQSADYAREIFQKRHDLQMMKTNLDKQVQSSDGFIIRVYDQLRRFMKWTGPVVFVSMLGTFITILALCHPTLRQFLGKSGSLKLGALTLNFQDLQAVRQNIRTRFKELDADISNTYLKNLQSAEIEDRFADVKADLNAAFANIANVDLMKIKHRATLFVPGFSGDELVQATGYLGAGMEISRYGAGRRFSVRYGMIGKAWRLRAGQYNPSVDNFANNLIRNFGLTRAEADRIAPRSGDKYKQKGSLMSFVIRNAKDDDNADPLGVIYIEAFAAGELVTGQDTDELNKIAAGNDDGMSMGDLTGEAIWASITGNESVRQLTKTLMQLRNDFDWDTKLVNEAGR